MKTKLLSLLVVFICFSLCSCSLFVAMPAKEKTELVVKEEITIDDNKPFLERYLPFVKVDDGYSLFDAAYLKGTEFEYAAYELRSQTAAETNYDDYYIWDKQTLEELDLVISEMEDSDFFIVNYETEQVIYPLGYKHTDGNIYYTLTEIIEL